jgi:hypothetical protein
MMLKPQKVNISHDASFPEAKHVQLLEIYCVSIFNRMWPQIPIEESVGDLLTRLGPREGPCTDLDQHSYFNDPKFMDVNLTCLIMQNEDLPVLFGRIGCLANMNVKIKDLEEFAC